MDKPLSVGKSEGFRMSTSIPWAWSAAWLLVGAGLWLSDVASYPSRSLFAYILLSAIGWGLAALVTVRAAGGAPGKTIRWAAWFAAFMVATFLGLAWMRLWNPPFLGIPVAVGVAGAIGGIANSLRPAWWRLVTGALLGVLFLVLSVASFFASYILLIVYTGIAQRYGDIPLLVGPAWIIPGAVFGLVAGFGVRWLLGLRSAAVNSSNPL